MIGIFNLDNLLLTPYVSLITNQEPMKIVNHLLDGTYHVQILGATQVAELEIYADNVGKALLETADRNGEQLSVVIRDKNWQGILLSLGTWKRISQKYYQTTAKMSLYGTGGS